MGESYEVNGGTLSFINPAYDIESAGTYCEGPADTANGYDVDCNSKGSAFAVYGAWSYTLVL